MKKIVVFSLALVMMLASVITVNAINDKNNEAEDYILKCDEFDFACKSAVLMEAETGEILYSFNADEAMPPASVTKVMTLLIVMEAIDEGLIKSEDEVLISRYASSMGGSQVFLREGERMTVEELIKCAVIASANDACVALAEHVAGSESAFVDRMNERAGQLGMTGAHFENTTGLDDTTVNHVLSALDIAKMSKELIKYDLITRYSSTWQDEIRDGEFVLTNTNRLVRYYDGCTGLKTGSTDKAGFCISATAKRDGMHLIAVVMGAETRDERNSIARSMLDYGFANFTLFSVSEQEIGEIKVNHGKNSSVKIYAPAFNKVINKADKGKVERVFDLADEIDAPIEAGAEIGRVNYTVNGKRLCENAIFVKENVEKVGFFDLYLRLLEYYFVGK